MALCLITISGTSGSLELVYTISGNENHTYIGSPGTIGIDDTATSVQSITHTGDLTASSLCLTVTNVSPVCKEFIWEKISEIYTARGIQFGSSFMTFSSNFDLIENVKGIAQAINSLDDYRIKAIAIKSSITTDSQRGNVVNSINNLKVKVYSDETLIYLVFKSEDDLSTIYVPLTDSTCSLTGYLEIPICSYETPSV